MFEVVLAIDNNYGIGKSDFDGMVWDVKNDMKHFADITNSKGDTTKVHPNILIMGRTTADTFKKPLPRRTNVVLTSKVDYRKEEGFVSFHSFEQILTFLHNTDHHKAFVIGGAKLFAEAYKYKSLIDVMHFSVIHPHKKFDYEQDVRIKLEEEFSETWSSRDQKNIGWDCCLEKKLTNEEDKKNNIKVDLEFWTLTPKYEELEGEEKYLDLMKDLLFAQRRGTRNAVTQSLFCENLTFDLKKGFPALTTKRLYWRGVVEELLFFLGGCTDNKYLQDRKVHIWDGNTTKEFIKGRGLDYEEGDLGPMYGFHWRYYGAEYKGKDCDYTGQGIDQFANLIRDLLNNPTSRRMLLTTYNTSQIDQAVLPPCHGLVVQFYVGNDFSVDCSMYQRSADWFLGVPFNIASYALLVHIVVNILNNRSPLEQYSVGKLHITFGDYHLYSNHMKQAFTQIKREIREMPSLKITKEITSIEPKFFLDQLEYENFVLEGYNPHPAIKAKMTA